MRYQINQGWLIDQTLIPHGVIIAADGKADHELTPEERLARGRIPPLNSTALDFDSALTLWRKYPDRRHELRRNLSPFDQEIFERLLTTDEATLERLWPQGAG